MTDACQDFSFKARRALDHRYCAFAGIRYTVAVESEAVGQSVKSATHLATCGRDRLRITCAMGPFLPVPPLRGGAVEKIFHALCVEWARRGHRVTILSREFDGLARSEWIDGVCYLRLRSADAPRSKLLYRVLDVIYALRVRWSLPPADITITHSVSMPLVLPKRRAGRIYVSVGRFPKGQMGFYRRADRLQAVSTTVAQAICAQAPSLISRVRVVPNALAATYAEALRSGASGARQLEVLYVGRLAREKGVDRLVHAFASLARDFVGWRLTIVGPHEPSAGGDGESFLTELKALSNGLPVVFEPPIYDERALVARYSAATVLAYPSLAEKGESFGMVPLEAMACGTPVVVSDLDCFRDFVEPGINALQFSRAGRAGTNLENVLRQLLASETLRAQLSHAGRETARRFTAPDVAALFEQDFYELLGSISPTAGT